MPIAPASADSAEVLALLRQIAADLHTLAAAAHPAGGRNEDAALGGLLRAIVATAGRVAFSSAELVEHAALPPAATLRAAIVAAVGTVNPRRLGKVLRAIEGREIGGLQVVAKARTAKALFVGLRKSLPHFRSCPDGVAHAASHQTQGDRHTWNDSAN